MRFQLYWLVMLALLLMEPVSGWGQLVGATAKSHKLERIDAYTLRGPRHFVHGYAPRSDNGLVQMVVEIPSGTSAKWETDPDDGLLKWEFREGKPRVVRFLPYPCNYGMIPQTLLPEKLGGDGDPLDIVLLAPAVSRGTLVRVRVIGVLEFLDGGQRDDKILAVMPGTPLGHINSLAQLRQEFPQALEIIQQWFINYKDPGEMRLRGTSDQPRANEMLEEAIRQYEQHPNRQG